MSKIVVPLSESVWMAGSIAAPETSVSASRKRIARLDARGGIRTAAVSRVWPASPRDRVWVAVDAPRERQVQIEVALVQEPSLGGLDPGHVLVGLLLLHLDHALVEEGL